MKRALALLTLLLALPAFAFDRQPGGDYKARRERLAAKLGRSVLVLFAGTEDEGQNATRGFRQDNDFFYLTGWSEPGAAVVVAAATDARPYTEILFLPAQNVSQERWTGPKLTAARADALSVTGFDRVEPLDRLRDELVRVLPSPTAVVQTDLSEPAKAPLAWLRRANAFPNYVSFNDADPVLAELRLTKDAGEIALIRKATNATVEAHRAAAKAVKAGASENEVAGLIEYNFRRGGCESSAFSSIVGSGLNSTVLHYAANSGTMAAGDVVVIDIGAECSMYASDVTRTLPVSGRFTPRQREIYDIVLGAQNAAVAAFQSGVSTIGRIGGSSLYAVARDYINTHGKDIHGEPLGKYFIHGLSHYVGLEVHDTGSVTAPLLPGAVFTIEPGIYIPEEKIGVRIEDTYVVRADGTLDCLSCGAVKTAVEIEKAMGK
ncbi:MAG: aminopeptidase P family protein [Thermoanaerobaculia bacterium]|nr:aminopeptidase P family protein [Thermoanaerobaculia bacterium]